MTFIDAFVGIKYIECKDKSSKCNKVKNVVFEQIMIFYNC